MNLWYHTLTPLGLPQRLIGDYAFFMEKAIRILLVDDHPAVREGVQRMLEREEDMEVVGQSANGEEALLQAGKLCPNIALVDIKMPGMDGIELTRQLKERQPCCVIMFSLYGEYLDEAIKAGATGYLTKDAKRAELTQAIRQVYHGQVVISESIPSEIRDKYPGEKAGEALDMKEVQLVIPPIEANHLIRFISRVEEMLSCSVQVVSSWQEGTVIILSFKMATPLTDILNKLAEMPEVEAIVEKPPPRKALLSLLKKAMSIRKTINNPKTILVTLKSSASESGRQEVADLMDKLAAAMGQGLKGATD
ncbi:Protein-glutamate methylesterase/protein-glutamine glutaminase [subsurface metagenome]